MTNRDQHFPRDSPESDAPNDAVIGRALRWSLVVFLIVGSIAAGIGYWITRPQPEPVEKQTKLSLPELRDAPTIPVPEIPFSDITQEAGIDFVFENGAAGEKLLPETMGGGCAFFDYGNDGWRDVFIPAVGLNRLFRNVDGRFTDVTRAAGVAGARGELAMAQPRNGRRHSAGSRRLHHRHTTGADAAGR